MATSPASNEARSVEQILPSLLKRNLIVKPTHAQQLQLQQQHTAEDGGGEGDGMAIFISL